MDGRERFNQVMRFEPVDRVPNYELGVWAQTRPRWYSEGMAQDCCHWNWFEGEASLGIERRGFSHINVSLLPAFEYEVLEEDERYVTARAENGVVTKALKEGSLGRGRMCMDQYLAHPVTDRKSFDEMKKRYDPSAPVRYPQWWDEQVRMWKTRDYPLCLLGNGTFGLYSQLRSWVGTEEISVLFYDDPAFVEEMLDFNTDFLLATVEKALNEVEYDYFNFFEDLAGKGGPLISPSLFRRFLMPQYRRIVERFRRAGVRYFWVDSDGDVEALIPLWIESGITCLWPLEQASGMDPRRLRREYGRDLALAGGIDKIELTKDRAAIERELTAKIPPMLESGGYLPHLDHCFPPDISYDNFQYYMELKRKLILAA